MGLLQDNDSKYGTLVAMKCPRQIEASRPISLQIGRTMLSLSLTAADSSSPPVAVVPPQPIGLLSCGSEPTGEGGLIARLCRWFSMHRSEQQSLVREVKGFPSCTDQICRRA